MTGSSVTVAVVGICGAAHLARCLEALEGQAGAPPFETVVVYDPGLDDVHALAASRPGVRFVSNEGQRAPLELAARAVDEAAGEVVVLTEDHCVPDPDWLARLLDALRPGRAAAGGAVELAPGAEPLDWAFWFVDFHRYARPFPEGPAPSLTVCNVAYRRDDLEAIAPVRETIFHETEVNRALAERFGPLWRTPEAVVTMRRRVAFADAVRERYAFGRLYGATRSGFLSRPTRSAYTALAPLLPPLLLGRMARKALPASRLRGPFFRALPALVALVVAWSWGEWLGYLTRRSPDDLTVAPEVRAE